ncbi:Ark- serine/threonine protein kinase [Microbotryomycetes sp. JL221]|nr:Ark- serine/threonine protein kinase [Microbotryomycetes sp. JL221]
MQAITQRQHYPSSSSASPSNGTSTLVAPTAVSGPEGTLPTGTIVRVGQFQVRVERFLSEGGFAHVYLATSSTPIPSSSNQPTTKHVLKRIAVPDTKGVELVGKEVEVMKVLRNHPKIVNLIEASVSELPGGVNGSKGYEIFILMEWCAGGGIIDMMNQRLQNRLTETEILKIFGDTVEAVAHMHYQSPPLIHRDLKVENILLQPQPQTFKLCDFGSTTTPIRRDKVPTAVESLQKMEQEINKTTTLQYRAPELVDVWSRKGFDEKVDIWALGVLLYKLCYYTTPFEEHGPLAILNAQYKIPPYPAYSSSMKTMIQGMLQENPNSRPNIYQVHEQVCRLRGTTIKLENKYSNSSSMNSPINNKVHSSKLSSSSSVYDSILSSSPSNSTQQQQQILLNNLGEGISPMRRGRPLKYTTGVSGDSSTTTQSPSSSSKALTSKTTTNQSTIEPIPRLVKTGSDGISSTKQWQSLGTTKLTSSSSGGGIENSKSTMKSLPSNDSTSLIGFDDSFTNENLGTTSNSSKLVDHRRDQVANSTSRDGSGVRTESPLSTNAFVNRQNVVDDSDLADDVDDRVRFESQFPSLDDDGDEQVGFDSNQLVDTSTSEDTVVKSSSSSFNALRSPSRFNEPLFTPKLTGQDDKSDNQSPALPRRPPDASVTSPKLNGDRTNVPISSKKAPSSLSLSIKPDLVSRSSQTSPQLLDNWKLPNSSHDMLRLDKSSSQIETNDQQNKERNKPRALSGLGLSQTSSSPQQPSKLMTNKQPSFDLLGDDDEQLPQEVNRFSQSIMTKRFDAKKLETSMTDKERQKFKPVRPTFGTTNHDKSNTNSNKIQNRTIDDSTFIEQRYPPLDQLDDINDFSKPIQRQSSTESSDDDMIEDFEPKKRLDSSSKVESIQTQRIEPLRQESDVSDTGGDIDLGPALASIQKFAPIDNQSMSNFSSTPTTTRESSSTTNNDNNDNSQKRQPPILAPKPTSLKRQDQINSLVTKFDRSMSPSHSSLRNSVRLDNGVVDDDKKPLPIPPTSQGSTTTTTIKSTKPRPQFGSGSKQNQTQSQMNKSSSSSSSSPKLLSTHDSTDSKSLQRPPPFKPVGPTFKQNSPSLRSTSSLNFDSNNSNQIRNSNSKTYNQNVDLIDTTNQNQHIEINQFDQQRQQRQKNDDEDEDDEPKFKGVGTMKQRWEAMSSKSSSSTIETHLEPTKKIKQRKEWAAI